MAPTITAPNARATARYQHVSPYKVRQVLDLVRGLSVDDAERMLQLCEKDAADDVLEGARVRDRERRAQLPAAGRRALRRDRIRRRRPDPQVGPAPCARPVLPDPQAHVAHHVDRRPLRRGRARARVSASRSRRVAARRCSSGAGPSACAGRVATAAEEHDHDHDHEHAEDLADDPTTLAGEVAEASEGEYVDVDEAIEAEEQADAAEGAADDAVEADDADASDDADDSEESK